MAVSIASPTSAIVAAVQGHFGEAGSVFGWREMARLNSVATAMMKANGNVVAKPQPWVCGFMTLIQIHITMPIDGRDGTASVVLGDQDQAALAQLMLRSKSDTGRDPTTGADLGAGPGAGKTKRAYLFAYRSTGDAPIVVFDYCTNRSGKHAAAFLGDWRGAAESWTRLATARPTGLFAIAFATGLHASINCLAICWASEFRLVASGL
mgnify:CR=1 FL=1